MKTLRPYQSEALEAIVADLKEKVSTVCVLPTGLGKTVLAAKLITGWDRGNCLFLAHTRELVYQAAEKLSVELGYPPVVEMGDHGADIDLLYGGGMTVVASVQSMYGDKRLAKFSRDKFGLIVVDECHHATSATYKKVLDHFRLLNPELRVVGITATPVRSDGAALGSVFRSVAFQMSIREATDGGWLVPVQQEYVTVESLSFDGIDTKKNDFGDGDFVASQLDEVLQDEEVLHGMARPILDKVGDRPTLVFCASVAHAHAMASVLNRYKERSAAAVDGSTDRVDRQMVLSDFSEGRKQFLCNCQVLTEGFDAPVCAAIAMGRPTKSQSLYAQMLGRGLRPLPGVVDGILDATDRRLAVLTSGKPSCLVLDFVGNSDHKLVDSYDVLGGHFDHATRELARREAKAGRSDVKEAMDRAKALLALEREFAGRRGITAEVQYGSYEVDPYNDGPSPGVGQTAKGRGGATDAQVGFLVGLGVDRQTALGYSKRQAGAVIDSMRQTRCTAKQANALRRNGINPDGVGVERAGRILDALAANGWRPLEVLPE